MQVNIFIAKRIGFTWWQRPSGQEYSKGVRNALLESTKKGHAQERVNIVCGRGEIGCNVQKSSGWRINIQHLAKPIRHVRLRCYINYPYCTFYCLQQCQLLPVYYIPIQIYTFQVRRALWEQSTRWDTRMCKRIPGQFFWTDFISKCI